MVQIATYKHADDWGFLGDGKHDIVLPTMEQKDVIERSVPLNVEAAASAAQRLPAGFPCATRLGRGERIGCGDPVDPVGLAMAMAQCAWWGSQRWYGWCEKPLHNGDLSSKRGDLINKDLRNLGTKHQVSWICTVYIPNYKLSHTINIHKFLPTWLAKKDQKGASMGRWRPSSTWGLLRTGDPKYPQINIFKVHHVHPIIDIHRILGSLIELDDGKIYRKPLYLMVKTMVSCRFSLKPIHWLTQFWNKKPNHPSDLGAGVGSISGCSKLLRLPQLQGDVGELGMDPFWLRYVDQNASPSPQNPVVKIITFQIKTYPNCHLLVVICQFWPSSHVKKWMIFEQPRTQV